jgi:hypothetical protein
MTTFRKEAVAIETRYRLLWSGSARILTRQSGSRRLPAHCGLSESSRHVVECQGTGADVGSQEAGDTLSGPRHRTSDCKSYLQMTSTMAQVWRPSPSKVSQL